MIVIIDNYDSFTYNLYQYYLQLDTDVVVRRNDDITIEEVSDYEPDLIVLSPGPGTPAKAEFSARVLENFACKIPVLGVCLGHQVIVEYFGGKVIKGLEPVHGKVSEITHDKRTLFEDIPSPTPVTRYHSLTADEASIPEDLEVSARTLDGTIMAVRHRHLPVEGIQFHPESIMTKSGFLMLKNHFEQALKRKSSIIEIGGV
ncbi:anthranilate synthase component II [Thalassobacillus hwangdonensis]|uniref:Anthranilate synthase component II n=1 Tax=Thalassobacillus hwangdonensis TaxID=546108 RepID=A0ABW3L514_9BACI